MKRGVLVRLYFTFGLFFILNICEASDSSNAALIEVPKMDYENSPEKNNYDLPKIKAGEIQNVDKKLAEVYDVKKFWSILTNAPEKFEISRKEVYPEESLQYLPVTSHEQGYFDSEGSLELDNVENTKLIQSHYSDLPFALGKLQRSPNGVTYDELDIWNETPNGFHSPYYDPMFNVYLPRKQRSDEDILEQLEHDAIIHNILPTMDAPFFRDASHSVQEQLQLPLESPERGRVVAYMPTEYGIAIPILLGCSMTLTQGYKNILQHRPLPYYNSHIEWQVPKMADEYKK